MPSQLLLCRTMSGVITVLRRSLHGFPLLLCFSALKVPAKSPSFAVPVHLKHPKLPHCYSEVSFAPTAEGKSKSKHLEVTQCWSYRINLLPGWQNMFTQRGGHPAMAELLRTTSRHPFSNHMGFFPHFKISLQTQRHACMIYMHLSYSSAISIFSLREGLKSALIIIIIIIILQCLHGCCKKF